MKRRFINRLFAVALGFSAILAMPAAQAADEAPDALIKRLSTDVLQAIKDDPAIQAGDTGRVVNLVDTRVYRVRRAGRERCGWAGVRDQAWEFASVMRASRQAI